MSLFALRFGSPADIAIVLIVLLIVFGPKRLPQVGNELGQAMRELRKIADAQNRVGSSADKAGVFVFLLALVIMILLINGLASQG